MGKCGIDIVLLILLMVTMIGWEEPSADDPGIDFVIEDIDENWKLTD